MTCADFLRLTVFDYAGPFHLHIRKTSRGKPCLFPLLPAQSTPWGYAHTSGFSLPSSLTHPDSLVIEFVFLRSRFCYPFLQLTPHDAHLGIHYTVLAMSTSATDFHRLDIWHTRHTRDGHPRPSENTLIAHITDDRGGRYGYQHKICANFYLAIALQGLPFIPTLFVTCFRRNKSSMSTSNVI